MDNTEYVLNAVFFPRPLDMLCKYFQRLFVYNCDSRRVRTCLTDAKTGTSSNAHCATRRSSRQHTNTRSAKKCGTSASFSRRSGGVSTWPTEHLRNALSSGQSPTKASHRSVQGLLPRGCTEVRRHAVTTRLRSHGRWTLPSSNRSGRPHP